MVERILNGWKEISSHLERGVRTAQRWERHFGMPVHRPASRRRTAVVAFPGELDAWLVRSRCRLSSMEEEEDATDPVHLRQALFRLQNEAQQLAARLWYLEHNLRDSHEAIVPGTESPELIPGNPWSKPRDRSSIRRSLLRDTAGAN